MKTEHRRENSCVDSEQDVEFPACNLCGSRDRRTLIKPKKKLMDLRSTFSASHGVPGAQFIVRCEQCGLVYVCPRLGSDVVISAYENSSDERYVSQAKTRIATFSRCASLVAKYSRPPGRLLDVGAGAGFFCRCASDAGWNAQGIEPSHWLAEWGQSNLGVTIEVGTWDDVSYDESSLDVVSMWDSIEHMPDPMGCIRSVYSCLKTGAILVINTPNFASLLARLSGSRWWFLLSHHLFYFTPTTLSKMLTLVGFEILSIRPHVQCLELGYLASMAGIYNMPLSRLATRSLSVLRLGSLPIPYYASQMNVIARKL